jgi:hypothetical protein
VPVPAVPPPTSSPVPTRPAEPGTPAARRRRVGLALSAGTAALGVAMLVGLLGNPMATPEAIGGLAGQLGAGQLGALLVVLALLGLPAALDAPARVVRLTSAVQLVGYLVAVSTSHVIVLLGYLLAAAVPLGAVTVGVLACRRSPVARWLVLLGAAAAGVWGWLTGVLTVANVTQTFGRVGVALAARVGEQLVLLWLTAGVLVAGGVLLHAWAAHPARARWEGWLLRHRRVLTLVAAAGPLPYVLLRMTWLTPWPVGAPDGLDVSTRLWGLLLGSAGLTGTVLTLGLIRPWGSVAPRWLPALAGRRVPVAAAAVPAAVVATALVVAAVPMLVSTVTELGARDPVELVLFLVAFPFGVWGPALALATWAYVLHRRADGADRTGTAG